MTLRPLLFGVAVALLGVVLQFVYTRRFEEEASGGPRLELLVAAQPIEQCTPITAEMLGVRAVVRNTGDPRLLEAPPDISPDDLTDATARQAMQSRRRPIRLEVGGLQ